MALSNNNHMNIDSNNDIEIWNKLNNEAEERVLQVDTAKMPNMDHLSYKDYDNVYEPAEDTYLFLDTIQYELQLLHNKLQQQQHHQQDQQQQQCLVCVEIGCGSGVITTFTNNYWYMLNESYINNTTNSNTYIPMINIATDINLYALQVTQQTFQQNKKSSSTSSSTTEQQQQQCLELIHGDLLVPLLPRCSNMCDIILFNPPYVPTPDDEINNSGTIAAAWAGGIDGRRVIDRCIPQLVQVLKYPTGVAYIVTVDDNKPIELARHLQDKYNLTMQPVLRKRAKNEFLSIQKITWK